MRRDRCGWASWAVAVATVVAGCAGTSNSSPSRSPLIELRLADENGRSEWRAVDFDGTTLYLDPDPVLSDADLARVGPIVRPGQLVLQLEMSEAASERMLARTGAEVGNRLAIIVDGELRSAPVIRDAVRGPANLTIEASEREATRLADLIRSRWP